MERFPLKALAKKTVKTVILYSIENKDATTPLPLKICKDVNLRPIQDAQKPQM